jgi:hypothetical protein
LTALNKINIDKSSKDVISFVQGRTRACPLRYHRKRKVFEKLPYRLNHPAMRFKIGAGLNKKQTPMAVMSFGAAANN